MRRQGIKATFFLTGNFYRNPAFKTVIRRLWNDGHYLGAHSDKHLLYCDWVKRDSLLVSREEFTHDLLANYEEMAQFGVKRDDAPYFLPAYEWYNDSISAWTADLGFALINFTPGTISHADYTTPEMKNYRSSDVIFRSIVDYEAANGMNGFILLIHIGTDSKRKDKMYDRLAELVNYLKSRGYEFVRVDRMLAN